MGYLKKAAAVAGAGLVLAAAVPTLAGAAAKFQEVVVRNTDSEPVPTKAIGTTPVSGTVGINTPITIGGGTVGISGTPTVNVAGGSVDIPGGVAINGTPTVNVAGGSVAVAPPERFSLQLSVSPSSGAENCADLAVPSGKRYVVEAVHLDVSTSATDPSVYVRVVRAEPGFASLLRFTTPLTQWGAAFGSSRQLSGRVEGPFVTQALPSGASETLGLCVNDANTSARGVVVGLVESQ
jgi:hypothetical protein